MPVKWDETEVRRVIRDETVKLLGAAAVVVQNRARELLSVTGTGGEGGKKRRYGSNPSRPGEPPHKQYGHLRRSVAREVDRATLTARVGTNLKYGRCLELGTVRMAARPWLRRALAESRERIAGLFARVGPRAPGDE